MYQSIIIFVLFLLAVSWSVFFLVKPTIQMDLKYHNMMLGISPSYHEHYTTEVFNIPRVVANTLVNAVDNLEKRVKEQADDDGGIENEPDVYIDKMGLRELINCSHPNETLCTDITKTSKYNNYADLDENRVKLFASEIRDIVASGLVTDS